MRVCILGVSGLLGQAALRVAAEDPAFDRICGVARRAFAPASGDRALLGERYEAAAADLEAEDGLAVLTVFKPDLVLNCAAFVDLAGCEKDPLRARRSNADLPTRLGAYCAARKIRLAHVSTDQVFDGAASRPYAETDATNPLHAYGRTKLAGERGLLRAYPDGLVVRANIVGVRGRRDEPVFAEWLCGALLEGREILLAEDFVTSPVTARFLAGALVRASRAGLSGVYHIGSAEPISKYDFGKAAARRLGTPFDRVKRGKVSDLKLVPPRPGHLALDPGRLRTALDLELPSGSSAAEEAARDYLIWRKTWA